MPRDSEPVSFDDVEILRTTDLALHCEIDGEWLEWPNKAGWWWNFSDGVFSIYLFKWYEYLDMFSFDSGDSRWDVDLRDGNWDRKWKYQEEPDIP